MECKRAMYQVLQGVLVVRDGGQTAKKSSGWRARHFPIVKLQDKMHTIVPVPPWG